MTIDTTRASGVLLHPVSLPDPGEAATSGKAPAFPTLPAPGSGDFGQSAFDFVDWLAAAGQQLWQVLPLGPVGPGNSPYMSPSAFALNPLLIDLQDLVSKGWLDPAVAQQVAEAAPPGTRTDAGNRIDYATVTRFRMACLREAARRFFSTTTARDDFNLFCAKEATWLDDYALFMTIGERHPNLAWHQWPASLAGRDPAALTDARKRWHDEIGFWAFVQWTAYRQWGAVKRHAGGRGVRIIGDLPIFVALHSADVWANPALFDLDSHLRPRVVAGVPPDYFSATGQLWGNPVYRWDRHAEENYAWWIRRVRAALTTADLVRIDHFRGFAAYWEVPADALDAIDGNWILGPGLAFFDAVTADLRRHPESGLGDLQPAQLPIIAEDLGTVTPDVTALREAVGLPGMRVLQFAFGDDANNLYLPHNYSRDTVVYSGTHDNDTSLGWFSAAPASERARAQVYLKTDGREINWDLIHAASQSVAGMAIYPLQDVLGLGSDARMNRPGDAEGCWGWRFDWRQVQPWHAERLKQISAAHGRNGLR